MNRRFALKSVAAGGLLALVAGCSTANMGGGDIVDVASSNSDFSTLVAAVSAAGLVETSRFDLAIVETFYAVVARCAFRRPVLDDLL